MLGECYVVAKGDSLWRIAERKLGSGTQWPRIWKYNNRPEVARLTGRTIPNPDLIYVGQKILIPVLPGMKQRPLPGGTAPSPHAEAQLEQGALTSSRKFSAELKPETPKFARPGAPPSDVQTPASNGGRRSTLSDRLNTETSPIAVKYKLDDIKFPPTDAGTAIIEVRMTGDVVLMTKKHYPVTYVTSRGEIEVQATREANHAFGQLIQDNRFIYDSARKQITLRSMLVSQSNVPNTVATAIGVAMNSSTLTPKLRAEIRLPKLKGSVALFDYMAMDVKIVIEITPKMQPPSSPDGNLLSARRFSGPVAEPVKVTPRPAFAEPASATNWNMVIGMGIVVCAGALVVGTLVEDFFTVGAGVADDPASFALAGVSFRHGMAMMAGAAVVLPQTKVPASVRPRSSVTVGGNGIQ